MICPHFIISDTISIVTADVSAVLLTVLVKCAVSYDQRFDGGSTFAIFGAFIDNCVSLVDKRFILFRRHSKGRRWAGKVIKSAISDKPVRKSLGVVHTRFFKGIEVE